MIKRVLLGVAAGVIVALAATAGVSAYWQAQQTIPLETVSSGDLSVAASWRDGPPGWPALFPGESVEATIDVTVNGDGDTLMWQVRAESTGHSPLFAFDATLGSCGSTSQPLPAADSPDSLEVCVRYTLNADAPNASQGSLVSPIITVTAEQVGS